MYRLYLTTTTKKDPRLLAGLFYNMVEGGGFEPPKAELTDLQSAPFGHSGTPPHYIYQCRFLI